jgi:hypothetical protein
MQTHATAASSTTVHEDAPTAASAVTRPDIESVLRELNEELRLTLALLNGADKEVADLTLALLPFGSRATLVGYGVIETAAAAERDQAVQVSLTPYGRDLIAACAFDVDPNVVRERLAEFDAARARRASQTDDAPVRAFATRRR